MLDALMAAALENVGEPEQIRIDVRGWILNAVAHPRLCGQMDDSGELLAFEEVGDRGTVAEVESREAKSRFPEQPIEARLFEGRFVIIVEIVQADDLVAALQETHCGVIADESGCSGDQHFH
jgi:hypothetical protein